MNRIIKMFLGAICGLLTWCINMGYIMMCRVESKRLYRIPTPLNPDSLKKDFNAYKENLKKFGFRAVKRDFKVFRNYFIEKGNNPADIIPTYIVNNFLTPVMNPIEYSDAFEDKNMGDRLMPKGWMPKTFFRRINESYYDADYNKISDEEVKTCLNDLPSGSKIIVKIARNSSAGRGVKMFRKQKEEWLEIGDGSVSLFSALKTAWGKEDLIAQEVISQSAYISQFCDTSVNTLRMVIYNSPVDGRSHLIWCGLRVGAKGSIIDNNHAGGLIFAIDRDGKIAPYGSDQYGNKFSTFNGIDFENTDYVIPEFESVVARAKEAIRRLFPMRWVAFDIALDTDNKPLFVEFNLRGYSGWFCQFAGDPMFGNKTEEVLEYISQNRKLGKKVFYKIN